MPKSETASLLGEYHRIGGVATPRSAYGSSDSSATPRSPFDAGFPMMFNSPAPSPRPHRLSFAHAKDDASRGASVLLALLASVVGAGLLTMPHAFRLVAPWSATLALALVGAASAFSAAALLDTHVALSQRHEEALYVGAGKRFTSLQSLAVLAGGPALGYAVSGVTAAGIFAACVGAARVLRDLSPLVVSQLFALVSRGPDAGALAAATAAAWGDYLLAATFLVVVFPLCLVRNLSGLRLSSAVGFAVSLYLVAAVVYQATTTEADEATITPPPASTITPPPDATAAEREPRDALPPLARFAQCVALCSFALMPHLNLLPLFIQLRGSFAEPLPKSRRRMRELLLGATAAAALLYALFGSFGARRFGAATQGDVLLNLQRDARLALPLLAAFLAALAAFPLLFQPLRGVLEELAFAGADVPFATRLGATSCLLLAQLLLAALGPGLDVVLALAGATTCALLCFALPAALFTQLFPWRTARGGKTRMLALWATAAVFCSLGAVATWSLAARAGRS